MKVTVITATYRVDDMLERQAACLEDQTLDDFEWVVVDDHYAERVPPETSFPLTFVPPREMKDMFAPASAWNTGFLYANGDLAYFLNDYMLLTPRVLERHWGLFERYGPAVLISGPINPPPLTEAHRSPQRNIEGRQGPIVLDHDTTETKDWDHIKRWYWAGRNDSAGMAKCFEVNGVTTQEIQTILTHIGKYGPILSLSTKSGHVPEYYGKPDGPYWYTCPDGHVHLRVMS